MSPMEMGLRIPIFFFCLKTLSLFSESEAKLITETIYEYSWWVSRNLALYSSLGNHTICECVGLVFGGAVFAETGEGKDWLKKGCHLLDKELGHQILKDGGPAEQSLSYHRFVLDLYWLALDFLEKNRLHDCSSWKPALNKGELFLKSFGVDDGLSPAIGDSDDGHAAGPGLSPKKQVCDPGEDAAPTGLSFKTFPDSGYTVIRHDSDLFMSFDHGPLGMAPLYNHGHADALSFTLYIKKKPFFIDPGTFRYNGVPEHRAYFKGTRAHNTVCVDNMDQARQVTGFIWDKPYRAELISSREDEAGIWVKARQDGYSRLKSPVVHIRDIHVSRQEFCLVTDSFTGKGCHAFESHLHLDPGVRVDPMRDWLVLTNGEVRVFLHNPDNGGFRVVQGRESHLLGWFSPAYGVLEKTITLQSVKTGLAGETGFSALICFNEHRLETALEFKKETAGRL
ncbi:MAG: heparinase II/III family protein [Desulfobacula sp.]|nr:heparinase II/III family protein [Desulfobacula sp.]